MILLLPSDAEEKASERERRKKVKSTSFVNSIKN
jgi:hypothetical protein